MFCKAPKSSFSGNRLEIAQKFTKKKIRLPKTKKRAHHDIRNEEIRILTLAMKTSIVKMNYPSTQSPPNIP